MEVISLSTDKKQMCFELPQDLYIDLNKVLLEKFGKIYGNLKYAIQDALKMWIEQQWKELSQLKEGKNDVTG